ncbi:MAG: serine/threonine-protein kinase [Phycisphaerae bacterium]
MQETVTILLSTGNDSQPEPLEIPRRVANVKIGDMLGEGTGGVVFVGYDDALNRRVAVKFLHKRRGRLDPAGMTELANGIRAAARVKHPNIVTVHSVETAAAMPVIVMEFIDGLSMRDMLKRNGPMDLSLAAFVMRCITSAVAAMHAANVVHRDLKPANILFDRQGEAHVCDFGLACDIESGAMGGHVDVVGGSPLYMSPEMFDGQVSPQSDVYALGVMLFEMLAGVAPYTAETIEQMKAAHNRGEIPLHLLTRRHAPEALLDLLHRAVHVQRIMRFKSAQHMLRALEELPVPEKREDLLRQRLSTIVAARPSEKKTPGELKTDLPSMTTFDLVAQRAREKREGKRP